MYLKENRELKAIERVRKYCHTFAKINLMGTIPLSQNAVTGNGIKYGLDQWTLGLLDNFWTVFWTILREGQVTNFLYQRGREGENHNNAINI